MCKVPYNPPTIRQCITNNFSQMDFKSINFMILEFFVSLYFFEFIAKIDIFRNLLPYRPCQALVKNINSVENILHSLMQ